MCNGLRNCELNWRSAVQKCREIYQLPNLQLEAFAFGANDISIAHRHNKAILVDSGRGSATEPILDRHYRKQMQKFRINKEACDCSYSLSSQMGVGNGKGFLCSALTFLSGL